MRILLAEDDELLGSGLKAGLAQHGFAVDWMRKDLAMALAEADRMGLELALTRMVDGFYADLQAMGGGRWDTSSLLARLQAKT